MGQFGGSGEDKGLALALSGDGGVYFGGISGAGLPGAESAGELDGFVAAYDADGSQRWIRGVGAEASDQVSGLVARTDGLVIAVGHTGGTLGDESFGDNDAFAQALGSDGDVLWRTQTGTEADDRAVLAIAEADGTLLIIGHTYGALAPSAGGVDVFAVVVDATGAVGAAR